MDCKHIMAVEITCQRESNANGMTYSETVKVTYSQSWSAYNAAQTNEKAMFVTMLADLCKLVPNPPQGRGRPSLPMADMALASVYKSYSGMSSRRFASDLRDAQEKGLIERAPSFNAVTTYSATRT